MNENKNQEKPSRELNGTLPFRESWSKKIKSAFPELSERFFTHADVLPGTAVVSFVAGKPVGMGFLLAGPGFSELGHRELPKYYVHPEFEVLSDTALSELFLPEQYAGERLPDTVNEENWYGLYFEICDGIFAALKANFRTLRKEHPGKRLLLRTFSRGDNPGLLEYEMEQGFSPVGVMPVMRAYPAFLSEVLKASGRELPDSGKEYVTILPEIGQVRIRRAAADEAFFREYLPANGECFLVPDSRAELEYKIRKDGAELFAAYCDGQLAACVSVWPAGENTAATENIFCRSRYRRHGVTTELLLYVFDALLKEGTESAELSLFGEALPAFSLYRKLGYEITGTVLELVYDPEGESRLY